MSNYFRDWARSLDEDIGLDQDSIIFFHWAVEDEYESRFNEALEYYVDRPELLEQECASHLIELDLLEQRFLAAEAYEKCAAIRDIRADLTQKYRQHLVKTS